MEASNLREPTRHDNLPPIADLLVIHYEPAVLLERNAALVGAIGDHEKLLAALVAVDTEEANTAAAKLVKDTRALSTRVAACKELEKRPLLTAGANVETFVKGLGDTMDAHKRRIERLIGGFAQRKADDERLKREEEAAEIQRRADEQAALAATAEEAGHDKKAGMLLDQAVRKSGLAQTHAAGSVQELGRTRTEEGTTTVVTDWTHEIVDAEALKATMGPLGQCFTFDAVDAALRRFRKAEVAAGRDPVLVGVRFTKDLRGAVR